VPFPFYSHPLPYRTNNIFQKKNLEVIGIGALVRSWIQIQQHVGIFGSNDTDEELRFVCQMAICRDSSKSSRNFLSLYNAQLKAPTLACIGLCNFMLDS
jgi:hypothetical protein